MSQNSTQRYQNNLRMLVIAALGSKCCKCGYEDVRALQFDHINGQGTKQWKSLGPGQRCREVIKNPKDFQLLCANCNFIKRIENKEDGDRWKGHTLTRPNYNAREPYKWKQGSVKPLILSE